MDEEQEEVDQELEKASKGLKRGQADKFWDEAASGSAQKDDPEDGILTYEEARDKGLLSEDES